ncbi:hypothetical protein D9756_006534 [Leucocoprinus leucothites]|uniref:Uncharacterized protein n=1 Tax=Leucocoprinus leucothites TaxID=201217 RepID=A0A8H5G2G6_9AGAR|nr:hypothetical protein D9756_006534 [Leucoagaricus leucothites]
MTSSPSTSPSTHIIVFPAWHSHYSLQDSAPTASSPPLLKPDAPTLNAIWPLSPAAPSDTHFHSLLLTQIALPPTGPQFYTKVYHPGLNLVLEGVREVGEGFEGHMKRD